MTKLAFIEAYCDACPRLKFCGSEKCAPYYECENEQVEPIISEIAKHILEIDRLCAESPFPVFSTHTGYYAKDIFMDLEATRKLSEETGIPMDSDDCMYYSNVRILGRS